MSRHLRVVTAVLVTGVAACQKVQSAPPYSLVPVARRDIVVSATASGAIQPILTLSVKSKASGEILDMPVQTGDEVQKGQLLAKIDPRIPRNNLTQAQANVDVAQAQLENATAQLKRSETLYQSKSITEADYETAKLAYTSAKAALVTAQANLQTAKDAMEDTQVRAPNTGTILELNAVLGTVISSPTNDVAGGTVILKMANLDTVQVSALVDETDVGKVRPGSAVTITVDAYPNRQFAGRVLKIEPQAQVNQNVTMFPVDVNITNPGHLLKPGMNTEVEIHTGAREGVLAVPNAALRTLRDVGSAATVLGLDPQAVQRQIASAQTDSGAPAGGDTAVGDGGKLHAAEPRKGGGTSSRSSPPPALTAAPTADGSDASHVVFALRRGKITAVPIHTGLTDQDYIEVTTGLTEQDTVLVLASSPTR